MDSRKEDLKFFEEKIHIHCGYLFKFLMTITDDPSLAGDIVQETMATAWRKIYRIQSYSNVKKALAVIARNKICDYFNNNKPCVGLDLLSKEENKVIVAEDSLYSMLKYEERRIVLTAIGNLAKPHMKVILLHYYYDQPLKDIARLTNTNYNTVVSHHRRALKALKRFLRKEGRNGINPP